MDESGTAHWAWTLLASDAVGNLALALIGIISTWATARWANTETAKAEAARALSFVEAGVRDTYEEYVRGIKIGRADGKLTDAERETACRSAIARARNYAKENGVNLLRHYAEDYLPVLVEAIVRRFKARS